MKKLLKRLYLLLFKKENYTDLTEREVGLCKNPNAHNSVKQGLKYASDGKIKSLKYKK